MGRMNHDTRVQIVTLRDNGMSVRELQNRFKVSRRGIQRLCAKHRNNHTLSDLPRAGRPPLSTKRENRYLARLSITNPRLSARSLRQAWKVEYGVNASLRTVRNRLIAVGLKGRIAKKKPMLSKKNKKLRLRWAKERQGWSQYQWMQTFFSDETPVYLIQSNQRHYVRCGSKDVLSSRCLRPTVQAGGGKIMIWAGFTACGLSSLARVYGTINTECYINLLTENLLPLELPEHAIVYQQDNAPAHKSRRTMMWLSNHGIDILPWPAQSPDLNPMENAWAFLKQRLEERCDISTMDGLWNAIQQEWALIPDDYFEKLAISMQNRVRKVIAAKGGCIDY
jgi:transposase